MSETFGQAVSPVNTIRGILNRYPYSFGQLTEILQNSEDAGASKQIFVVDRRCHPTRSLYHRGLTTMQGPAFLAYNDAEFAEKDWYALQHAYESSKAEDSSKIGKFGVGFRSLFHITDYPQIVSASTMAILDPLAMFTGSHGVKMDLSSISSRYPDQLEPFQFFMPPSSGTFKGTVIRCPLRTLTSKISSRIIDPEEIVSEIFDKFIKEELHISLLFLRSIQQVEFYDIDDQGISNCLATLSISRSPVITHGIDSKTHILTTTIKRGSDTPDKVKQWRILHYQFSKEEAIQLISRTFPGDATEILKTRKLSPNVGIAIALDREINNKPLGQLFTYLPLPLPTGFPVHIHALFSIEDSRHHLVNSQTKGVVPGSDDHLVIIWNQLLFDHCIPQAWKLFLEILIETDNTINIFDAWPPNQGSPTSGEGVYWRLLPQRVFAAVTSSTSSVWPLYNRLSTSNTEYKSLDLLISAEPGVPRPVLDALTAMGLQLTCPPEHIHDLIKNSGGFLSLRPEVAHDSLLGHKDVLQKASKEDQEVVIDYLLSNGNVNNIIGLPIVPVVSGRTIALSPKSSASSGVQSHTMMNEVEYGIFGACDNEAIRLQSLPFKAAEILRLEGPKLLNVEKLSVARIVEYLTIYPNKLGLDLSLVRIDQRAIKWLSAFWFWMDTYEQKEDLFSKIRHLYLLPSTQGLRKAETPLFKSLGEHPNSVQHLSSIAIPFLDADLSSLAQNVIESHELLRKISNIHALLDSLPPSTGSQSLSQIACTTILRHVTMHAPGSTMQNGLFTTEKIRRLKNMPIFPMATFPSNSSGLVVKWTQIPESLSLRSIENPPFLPIVPGVGFIQLTPATLAILEYIEPSTSKRLANHAVLSLTVDNFTSQPDYVQAAALGYLVQHRSYIAPVILDKLRGMQFVAAMDGSMKEPTDVVDPTSKLVALYEDTPSRLARTITTTEQKIIRLLRALGMLQQNLTTPIAQERVNFISQISSPKAIDISRSLLSLVVSSRFDCSGLECTSTQRWLPTNKGLCGYRECRDATITRPNLFDQVLATMDPFNIPSSLIHVLGWNEPLSREVLIKQLDRVLGNEGDIFSKVRDIIGELSARSCNPTDIAELKKVTSGRKWVPTTDHRLAETRNAVFLAPIPESGFLQVLSLDKKMRVFLEQMGCEDSPTTNAVIANLRDLQGQPLSLNNVNISINLLRSLPTDPNDAERAQLLVPDSTNQLRPIAEVHFNDIGNHASLVSSGDDHIAHDLLEESLARKLGLGRLGLKYVDFSDTYVDMGQDLVTTVRNNLEQYKDKQFATEFLANAVDANATEFALVVNRFHPLPDESVQALSAELAPFCSSPSLVVYNNATFTDADFIGIRRTGIGGKEGKGDTIGQFGLGALTMFHFTEMAILISNSNVLFLNPSKEHLPIRDQASLMLPLKRVREYYPSHLACVDGLFGFNISSDESYNGTIFILPLRDGRHFRGAEFKAISQRTYTVDDICHILEDFKHSATDGCSASDCLLFTKIERIKELHRDPSGDLKVVWSVSATRTQEEIEPGTKFSTTEVTITNEESVTSTWKTVKTSVLKNNIPQNIITPILATSRPRFPAKAGLAVLLPSDATSHNSKSHRFFSTLPLSLQTSLPAHVMASFLLSPDRRSIRLDVHESKFNTWLLSNVIPPLYLFLLQKLLEHGENKHWWPGQSRSQADPYSRLIIDAFYSDHLKTSNRPILCNKYNTDNVLTPQEAVLSGSEPACVDKVLSILRSPTVAKPSRSVFQLMEKSGVPVVSPEFVKSEILQAASSGIPSQVTSKDIEDTIVYLLGDKMEAAVNLHDLPILPLENGERGTFRSRTNDDFSNFYVWIPQKPTNRLNFPHQYFVHPSLKKKLKETLLKVDVNVVPLDIEAVRRFITMKFVPPFSSPFEASAELSGWIDEFWESWEEYARLGLVPDHISEFPLVPTVRPNCFVSLLSCRDISSLLVQGSTEQYELIRVLLNSLGISVVRVSDDGFPSSLDRIIRDGNYPPFNLENVLKALGPGGTNSIAETIQGFDDELQTAFASWARSNINKTFSPELQPVAQQLPLWIAAHAGSTEDLRTASEIHMLPDGLPLIIASPFMNEYVAEYSSLRFLNGPKLTYEQMHEMLELPDILSLTSLQCYRQLLEVWLPRLSPTHTTAIPIPNSNMAVQASDFLYARDPLFETAFGRDSPHFIHPELQQLEEALYKHGLKTENHLDVAMFIECVEALDSIEEEAEEDDKVARATVLFEAYGLSLPMHIAAKENKEDIWQTLDDYSFIPRDMATRRLLPDQDHRLPGLGLPDNVTALPRIVTPPDLVRREFESIAWTQRASFADQPNQRVILAYPDLGRPSVAEVIAHIRKLSQMENLSQHQRLIVLHDLEESYRFLNDNTVTGISTLSLIGNESFFLNVDNPDSEDWRWDKADQLVFERQDIDEDIRHVRRFLLPFEKLLRAAGAIQVHYPQYPSTQAIDNPDTKLQIFRSGFQRLRESRELTDVIFIASDKGPDDEPLAAHRSFLAVCSEYFYDRFSGGFKEGGPASPENPIQCDVLDHSVDCVRSVLDYIYTGDQPAVEDLSIELVLDIMQLSSYWCIVDLFEDIQREIASKLLKPRLITQIKAAADRAEAEKLLKTCLEYEENNEALMRRAA